VLAKARNMDVTIAYGPVDEPWGVRRFFIRDPEGSLVNILSHS
jgi:catechol 2,3-dioxygenase-like lactoylglutathione lyase family enzyme